MSSKGRRDFHSTHLRSIQLVEIRGTNRRPNVPRLCEKSTPVMRLLIRNFQPFTGLKQGLRGLTLKTVQLIKACLFGRRSLLFVPSLAALQLKTSLIGLRSWCAQQETIIQSILTQRDVLYSTAHLSGRLHPIWGRKK